MSAREVQKFLEAAGDRLYTAFVLEMATGLRRGELLALRWEDINFEKGMVHINRTLVRVRTEEGPGRTELVYQEPKTEKSREPVPIPKVVLEELKRHRARQEEEKVFWGRAYQDNGLVFCTEDGKPLDPANFFPAVQEDP
ncbi:site-specific integrase [Moorellaceae bacterium AZ2]